MIDVNIITLENGEEYIVIDSIEYNNSKYLVLANEENDLDMAIRKVILENGVEYLVKLDSEDEYSEVMSAFNLKYRKSDGENEFE